MTFSQELPKKGFYKFTGPPENWITAIKYMTWGLEEKHRKRWAQIQPGDLFMMHSTSTETRLKNATSSIIGFGVVAAVSKREKNENLWIEEKEINQNKWPLLVPFSEIYLFSDFASENLPDVEFSNLSEIERLSEVLLKNSVPLAQVRGFPLQGSIQSVNPIVVDQIFTLAHSLHLISNNTGVVDYYNTPLIKYEEKQDVFRYATSLRNLKIVEKKIFSKDKKGIYIADPIQRERADNEHQETLEKLRQYFQNRGFDTLFNRHIDLFAFNSNESYLMEVKSLSSKNMISQSREGIVQLFEYEYFEINNFLEEKSLHVPVYKNLTFSREPKDLNYISFINSLDLGATYLENGELKSKGNSRVAPGKI